MHSGQGDEGPDDIYRSTPLPREPQAPSGSEPREGIVLPSKGGRWVPPSQRREPDRDQWQQQEPAAPPASGQPWGSPQPDPYGAQQPAPYGEPATPHPAEARADHALPPYDHSGGQQAPASYGGDTTASGYPGGDATAAGYQNGGYEAPYGSQQPVPGGEADRTQLLTPFGQQPGTSPLPGGDADRTQMLAPYGQQMPGGDADRTQMLAPYTGHSSELVPQAPESRPLPPEQRFDAPVPPMPQAPPPGAPQQYAAQLPGGAPFGDQTAAYDQSGGAPATQQLPRFDDSWQQGVPGPQPTQQQFDDYDYLYRRDDQPPQRSAAVARSTGAFPQAAPPAPQHPGAYGGDNGRSGGYGRGAQNPRGGGKKLSTPALVGIGVAVLAVLGIGIGVLTSGGSNGPQTPSASSSAPAVSGGAGGAAGQTAEQAKQLDALLKTSNSSRTSVISAVASIKGCENLSASSATLHAAARERDDLVTQLSGMTLTALPNSAELVGQLKAAWKASSAADDYYAEWGAQAARPKGCKGHNAKITPAEERGNLESGRATLAKQKAAGLWNPIAQQYGLTQRQYTQL